MILWFLWYLASFLAPAMLRQNHWGIEPYWRGPAFSVCLLFCGAFHLAIKGVRPRPCFVYGRCGVLLILPYFFGNFDRGLWFQSQAPALIVIQWIGFTVLLGAISAGIVTDVSRRKSKRKNWQGDLKKMADALCQKPEGDTVIGLADAAGLSLRRARKAIKELIEMRLAVPCKIATGRGDQELDGFQRAHPK